MSRSILGIVAILALAGCSLFHSPPAEAATVIVTWTNPTLNMDDTPIPATQGQPEALQTWRIEYGTCAAGGAFGTRVGEFTRTRTTGGPVLTSATQNLPAGNTCVRVFVSNFAGRESDASNVVARDVPAGRPRPAVNVQAELAAGS